MRLALLILLPVGLFAIPTEKKAPVKEPPAFRLDKRIPWTTSRVVGSPEPPHPYRTVRAFPKLKLANPMGVAHLPGTDQLLLIHQNGAWGGKGNIVVIKDDDSVEQAEPFLEVDGIAYGVAFHPNFKDNGYLYVGMNGPFTGDPKKTKVLRYRVDRKTNRVVPKSQKVIIEWLSNGHNGGDLAFGKDGMLYVSSGDGTSDSDTDLAGQDLTRLLAKVLRIDVDKVEKGKTYSIPKDNPFVGQKGIVPETWAYGFRNPWRLHIDPQSGDLWVGNNGQDIWEQIYLIEKGANYGWSVLEGSHPFYLNRKAGPHPFAKPIAEHHHSEARSMTGGVVYHGAKLPGLKGAYLYGDFSTGRIWGIRHQKGKVTWHEELVDTPYQITGFGVDSKGELLVADHGGAYYRLEPTPKQENPPAFPRKLSETGVFTSVKGHVVDPALVPYSVNAPLWSDGAHKERFIGVVGDGIIDMTANRGWNFPDGSVIVKTFSLDQQRIETRLLVREQGEWAGYSYAWNDEQTEATLVEKNGLDRKFTIRDPNAPGGKRSQTWHYPSRAECMVCHSRAANYVLGLSTVQMNKVHDYGTARVNQLTALEGLGFFRFNVADHVGEVKGLVRNLTNDVRRVPGRVFDMLSPLTPKPPVVLRNLGNDAQRLVDRGVDHVQQKMSRPIEWAEKVTLGKPRQTNLIPKAPGKYASLADPADRSKPLEARARAYLHSNCSQCHVEAGGGNAAIELEHHQPRDKMRLFGVKPQHDTFGVAGAKLIEPGHPEKSVLYLRMARREKGQMPPLASAEVDREAVQLIHDWIKAMK